MEDGDELSVETQVIDPGANPIGIPMLRIVVDLTGTGQEGDGDGVNMGEFFDLDLDRRGAGCTGHTIDLE